MSASRPSSGPFDVGPLPAPATFSFFPAQPPPVALRLHTSAPHDCPYLPGRQSTSRAFWAERMPGAVYHRFMDAGFRRSGKVFYQPVCAGCRACQPLRVPVATFAASKSQRRCWRRNADLGVTLVVDPAPDAERFDLYQRYVSQWHGKDASDPDEGWEAFTSFLYESPVDTVEYLYRDPADGGLLAVGVCDVCADSFSSVYFYHDPAHAHRGLGTYGALYEIEEARRLGVPHYYLGFWVDGCGTMHYKAGFRPNEVLHPDGVWRPNAEPSPHAKWPITAG